MEQHGRELDGWQELVQKAVDAEAKANLLSSSMLREKDQRAPRGKQTAETTKSSHRGTPTKDPRIEQLRARLQPTTLQRSEEASDKAQREKKKNHCNRGRDRGRDQRGQEGSTPATGVNALEHGETGKKKKNQNRSDRVLSSVTYYNCDKKGYYLNSCPEPPKKKLAAVSATSTSMTVAGMEAVPAVGPSPESPALAIRAPLPLERVPCIHY